MQFKKTDIICSISVLCPLVICNIFNRIPYFSWIAILVFAIYCFYLVHNHFSLTIKFFPLLFTTISLITGVVFCEFSSLSLYEINEKARFAGSLPLLILTHFIFFQVLLFLDRPAQRYNINIVQIKKYPKQCHYVAIASSFVLFCMFIRIIKYPAFLLGYDRFEYANNVVASSGIWRKFESISYALILFPLLDYYNGHKISGIWGISCYVLFYLWNGNKFGPFYTVAVVFFLVEYDKFAIIQKKKIKKYILLGGIIVVGLIAVATILQTSIMKGSWIDYLGKRVSQQGQLWWKTYDSTYSFHLDEISDEIYGALHGSSTVADNVDANYGIYKIMYYCGNPHYISYKLGAGSRFTEAGYASAYYYFGAVGCIVFAILYAIILSTTVKAIIRALQKGKVIRIAILARLYTIERISYSMFTFMDYLDELSFISYIYLAFSQFKLPKKDICTKIETLK